MSAETERIAEMKAYLREQDRRYVRRYRLLPRLAEAAFRLTVQLDGSLLLSCYAQVLCRLAALPAPEAVYAAGKALDPGADWRAGYSACLSAELCTPAAERLERRLGRFYRRILKAGGSPATLREFDGLLRDLTRCTDELLPEVFLAGRLAQNETEKPVG